jgi:hypothetical protein
VSRHYAHPSTCLQVQDRSSGVGPPSQPVIARDSYVACRSSGSSHAYLCRFLGSTHRGRLSRGERETHQDYTGHTQATGIR